MLYGGSAASGSGNSNDIYKTAVIDTMVAEIQSVPGEDRCVLLLGYKEQMTEMFQVSVSLGTAETPFLSLSQERQSRTFEAFCHRRCFQFRGLH
jgi:hypothetical protein